MRTRSLTIAALLALWACGTTASSTDGPTCDELQAAARGEVAKAFERNQSCAKDGDCKEASFSAGCFDSCSRAVNLSGASDVAATQDRVNAAQCREFTAKGCKVVIPPCVPPDTPKCVAGVCQ
jgi:hypothetical protein